MTKYLQHPSNSCRSGFTLIELLLASAMFALLAGALYGVFSSALRLREKGQGNFEKTSNEDAALEILRRDFRSMMIPDGTLAGPLLGQTGLRDSNSATLEFSTASGSVSDAAPWGDVQKVNYLLSESDALEGAETSFDLAREVDRNLLTTADSEPEAQPLLSGVSALEFQYLNPDGLVWEDTWDSAAKENVPPAAIKVHIEFAEPTGQAPQRRPLEMVCEIPVRTADSSTSETSASSGGEVAP